MGIIMQESGKVCFETDKENYLTSVKEVPEITVTERYFCSFF